LVSSDVTMSHIENHSGGVNGQFVGLYPGIVDLDRSMEFDYQITSGTEARFA
jgi:hypothetical protein